MRWKGGRRSRYVEDRRGLGPARRRRAGIPVGIGGLAIIAIFVLLGGDPAQILQILSEAPTESRVPESPPSRPAADDEQADFVSVVLADTEDVWSILFADAGRRYAPPTLVLFRDAVDSACGFNSAAVGPFYCPADRKAYIDLSFYDELARRFGAPGDFAQAYVLAHEVGHHVQNLLGVSEQVHSLRRRVDEVEGNRLSVRQELQADCFAGIWAHHANRQRQLLETGDLEEGLDAASAIGDDTLQRRAGGRVAPDSFTHGTGQQRVRWFSRGFESGRIDDCDTFASDDL